METPEVRYARSGDVGILVAGSGLAFHDRGAHELKGIPGEWRLFAVDAAA